MDNREEHSASSGVPEELVGGGGSRTPRPQSGFAAPPESGKSSGWVSDRSGSGSGWESGHSDAIPDSGRWGVTTPVTTGKWLKRRLHRVTARWLTALDKCVVRALAVGYHDAPGFPGVSLAERRWTWESEAAAQVEAAVLYLPSVVLMLTIAIVGHLAVAYYFAVGRASASDSRIKPLFLAAAHVALAIVCALLIRKEAIIRSKLGPPYKANPLQELSESDLETGQKAEIRSYVESTRSFALCTVLAAMALLAAVEVCWSGVGDVRPPDISLVYLVLVALGVQSGVVSGAATSYSHAVWGVLAVALPPLLVTLRFMWHDRHPVVDDALVSFLVAQAVVGLSQGAALNAHVRLSIARLERHEGVALLDSIASRVSLARTRRNLYRYAVGALQVITDRAMDKLGRQLKEFGRTIDAVVKSEIATLRQEYGRQLRGNEAHGRPASSQVEVEEEGMIDRGSTTSHLHTALDMLMDETRPDAQRRDHEMVHEMDVQEYRDAAVQAIRALEQQQPVGPPSSARPFVSRRLEARPANPAAIAAAALRAEERGLAPVDKVLAGPDAFSEPQPILTPIGHRRFEQLTTPSEGVAPLPMLGSPWTGPAKQEALPRKRLPLGPVGASTEGSHGELHANLDGGGRHPGVRRDEDALTPVVRPQAAALAPACVSEGDRIPEDGTTTPPAPPSPVDAPKSPLPTSTTPAPFRLIVSVPDTLHAEYVALPHVAALPAGWGLPLLESELAHGWACHARIMTPCRASRSGPGRAPKPWPWSLNPPPGMASGVDLMGRTSQAERAAALTGQSSGEADAVAAKWLSWKGSRARNNKLISTLLGQIPPSKDAQPLPLPIVFTEESSSMTPPTRTPRIKLGLHVLEVASEHVCRKMTARFLQELGCTCDCLAEGGDVPGALFFAAKPVDVILLDILMPRSNGIEVCRHLRTDLAVDIPIVAVPSSFNASEARMYRSVGFSRVLEKPYTSAALEGALTQALGFKLSRATVAAGLLPEYR